MSKAEQIRTALEKAILEGLTANEVSDATMNVARAYLKDLERPSTPGNRKAPKSETEQIINDAFLGKVVSAPFGAGRASR
jgi:hypothetical protein